MIVFTRIYIRSTAGRCCAVVRHGHIATHDPVLEELIEKEKRANKNDEHNHVDVGQAREYGPLRAERRVDEQIEVERGEHETHERAHLDHAGAIRDQVLLVEVRAERVRYGRVFPVVDRPERGEEQIEADKQRLHLEILVQDFLFCPPIFKAFLWFNILTF